MTPELLWEAHAEVETAMFDANGNGPWLEIADHALRKRHVLEQAMILGMALGTVDTDAKFAAWKHLLDRFHRRNEGAAPSVYPPELHRLPRPVSVIPGESPGFRRRRSRHR